MISQKKLNEIKQMKEDGLNAEEIANNLNVAMRTARRYLRLVNNKRGKQNKIPKILLIDIETAPMICTVWGLYKQRIHHQNKLYDWFILSWSAKWLNDSKILSDVVTSSEAINKDDKRIMESMWDLLEESNVVLAHNGDRFDVRKINYRFLINGMKPTTPYQTIDTLKVAKRHFASSAYNLDYLCNELGLRVKIDTDYKLWKDCLEGNSTALKEMERYNKQDVLALEDLYMILRPWIRSHPNIGLYTELDVPVCSNCGSEDLIWKGYYYTPAGRFRSGRCNNCGAIFRSRYSDLTKEERKNLLISVAR